MDLISVMAQILFLSGAGITGLIIQRVARLDQSLACLVAGIACGFLIPVIGFDTGIRASNIQDLMYYVFLPIIIFEAAWNVDRTNLKHWFSLYINIVHWRVVT